MAYDDIVYVEEVVNPIKNNETLLGKPKVRECFGCTTLVLSRLNKIGTQGSQVIVYRCSESRIFSQN